MAVLGADAEPLRDPGAQPLDQDVGPLDQLQYAGGALGGLQVDQDGPLAAVGDVVGGIDREGATAGPVHPYDVRPQVGEEHGGERARADARQFDDAHARERAAAGHVPCHCHRAPSIPGATTATV